MELASDAVRPGGRAPTADAIAFGSEALLAIWGTYSNRPADLSLRPGCFLSFGTAAFAIAMSALGMQPAGMSRTTLANSLRKVVDEERAKTQPRAHLEIDVIS